MGGYSQQCEYLDLRRARATATSASQALTSMRHARNVTSMGRASERISFSPCSLSEERNAQSSSALFGESSWHRAAAPRRLPRRAHVPMIGRAGHTCWSLSWMASLGRRVERGEAIEGAGNVYGATALQDVLLLRLLPGTVRYVAALNPAYTVNSHCRRRPLRAKRMTAAAFSRFGFRIAEYTAVEPCSCACRAVPCRLSLVRSCVRPRAHTHRACPH